MAMKVKEITIKENVFLTDSVCLLSFSDPQWAAETRPGQFFNILVSRETDPLLRRPISIGDIKGGTLYFFYKIVGKGTEILSRKRKGATLSVMGPLGKGFPTDGETNCLIGGGIGVAPLIYLLRVLTENKKKAVLHGGFPSAGEDYLTPYQDNGLFRPNENIFIYTEDGSRGEKGYPTKNIEKMSGNQRLLTCGPLPLMKAAEQQGRKKEWASWHSLEERMACGAGACLGCVVQTLKGHQLVCKDGPVFTGKELPW